MPLPDMEAGALRRSLNDAFKRGVLFNSDLLVKNEVGNLAVFRKGEYIGFIDLRNAEVFLFEDHAAEIEEVLTRNEGNDDGWRHVQ